MATAAKPPKELPPPEQPFGEVRGGLIYVTTPWRDFFASNQRALAIVVRELS